MSLLPRRLLQSAKSFIVNRPSSIVFVLVFLFTIHYSLLTSAVKAAEQPNPQPCQNAKFDEDKLTDNWLTQDDGAPYITVTKPFDDQPVLFSFDVDFSKLSALFGPANSNYLEGNFQNKDHKAANISQLNAVNISKFHGVTQKAAPKAMLDPLKVETVEYIYGKNTLAESADIYTDFNGRNSKTIYDLRNTFGKPDPETQRGTDEWENGWGKYWDKIPTTYSEFYEGRIIFKYALEADFQRIINGENCPPQLPREITFVMPEFFRTTAVTGQLNQIIVPNAAQSDHSNDLVLAQNNPATRLGVLGKIISICSKFLKENPISNALEKVIGGLPKIFNPISNVYAEEPQGCIKILGPGKEGQDPYCALPAGQLQGNDDCVNQIDEFKQDTANENVVCTFYIEIPASFPAGTYGIWPVFRIPLISETWNNALFSDDAEPGIGSSNFQVTNRPGVYSWSTPRVIFENKLERLLSSCDPNVTDPLNDPSCTELINLANRLINCNPEEDPNSSSCLELDGLGIPLGEYDGFKNCVEQLGGGLQNWERQILGCAYTYIKTLSDLKKEPGESDQNSSNDARERFVGGVKCAGPHQNKNVNFLPKAAQEEFGITNECPLTAVSQLPNAGSGPPVGSPGDFPPTNDNCDGTYALDNPKRNFGDPFCDFSPEALAQYLQSLDPQKWETYYDIAFIEGGFAFRPNDYNPNSSNPNAGGAWGLYQMAQTGRGNTQYDQGDVYWQKQAYNAVQYNNQLPNNLKWCYWEAASPRYLDICGRP